MLSANAFHMPGAEMAVRKHSVSASITAAILLVMAISPAQAQPDSPVSAESVSAPHDAAPASATAEGDTAANACELHIWPSSGLRSIYHGWSHGGIVDGAVTGRDGYPVVPADPLDTKSQTDLLQTSAIASKLGRQDYRIVAHTEPRSTVHLRQTRQRLTASPSHCYAELILEDVFFQEDFVNGASLKSLIRFRDFEGSDEFQKQFGAWTKSKLVAFPPKEPAMNERALVELQSAFRANIDQFATALEKYVATGETKRK